MPNHVKLKIIKYCLCQTENYHINLKSCVNFQVALMQNHIKRKQTPAVYVLTPIGHLPSYSWGWQCYKFILIHFIFCVLICVMLTKNKQNVWRCKYHSKYTSVELNNSCWFLIHVIYSMLYLTQLLCLVCMHEYPPRHTKCILTAHRETVCVQTHMHTHYWSSYGQRYMLI
jgi:hypothetical protein